ncbi:hypothetical protein [Mycobacteroides salmoniphilum]|uniref:Uncharacterized protein n=1 Tax=Mycobacteroides salmoniphilum TaxID=404941 RepID=A0A4R8SZY8_9MYCO|nr:hypothetical protein [Mycobacteroides salmoniphilum]TEA09195.1 hypothetical protein CCUG60884_00185 [Mycobacteroides salmoniphilum]
MTTTEGVLPVGMRPREDRLAALRKLTTDELVERLDCMGAVAVVLGNHLADVAELVGLDRNSEDLAIPPRVRQLVSDPRVAEVLVEFKRREDEMAASYRKPQE